MNDQGGGVDLWVGHVTWNTDTRALTHTAIAVVTLAASFLTGASVCMDIAGCVDHFPKE